MRNDFFPIRGPFVRGEEKRDIWTLSEPGRLAPERKKSEVNQLHELPSTESIKDGSVRKQNSSA